MRASLVCGAVLMVIFTLCDIQSLLGTSVLDNTAPNADRLLLQRRDEDPAYPDDAYDSGEQDRWPTLEELENYSSKRKQAHKRGELQSPYQGEGNPAGSEVEMVYGKHPFTVKKLVGGLTSPLEEKERIMRRQNLENSLYDLLSAQPRPAPDRRTTDNLKDLYVLDLLKRHRIPRSPDNALPNEPQTEQLAPDKSSNKPVIG